MNVVTGAEMRELENEAIAQGGSIESLIARAGSAVADAVFRYGPRIIVLVGPGNNGEDGMVAARLLRQRGCSVSIFTFRRSAPPSDWPDATSLDDQSGRRRLQDALLDSHAVLDALLGTGQSRPPGAALAATIGIVNASSVPTRIAVDIPTGVDADTGAVKGEALRATRTLAMGSLKFGNVVYPGAEYNGICGVAEVGLPSAAEQRFEGWMPEDREFQDLLPRRSANSNKGSSGRLLIVGGSAAYTGAPALAAIAAYRVGAGLVEVALPSSARTGVAMHTLESVFTELPELDGRLAAAASAPLRDLLRHAKGALIGPGMGFSDETVELMRALLPMLAISSAPGSVIDADGLNALVHIPEWWSGDADLVLTPHPGEMARLTGLTIESVQAERLPIARHFATTWKKVVVLKGAGTLVVSPSGRVAVNPTGGPNLATAGTGDVLSGAIGSMIAQGMDSWMAAVAGVYLHGRAADLLHARLGETGMMASDLHLALAEARRLIQTNVKESP